MEIGTTFNTTSFVVHHPDGDLHYWFLVPENMTMEEAFESQEHHGPFATKAEADRNMGVVLLGEQCVVVPGAPTSNSLQ
jgi:hypothetical protein